MSRVPEINPEWVPLIAPAGYEMQMDISRPGGAVRHRWIATGQWRPGPVPESPKMWERVKAIAPSSDEPKGSADQ